MTALYTTVSGREGFYLKQDEKLFWFEDQELIERVWNTLNHLHHSEFEIPSSYRVELKEACSSDCCTMDGKCENCQKPAQLAVLIPVEQSKQKHPFGKQLPDDGAIALDKVLHGQKDEVTEGAEVPERADGYYWVKVKDLKSYWMIAQWIHQRWIITCDTDTYEDKNFEEIGERIERSSVPSESTEDTRQVQKELLELTIKAGRRLMHDFNHLLDEIPDSNVNRKEFEERAIIWRDIFYPDNGPKNYRTELHLTIDQLDSKLSKAKLRLKENGIDYLDL